MKHAILNSTYALEFTVVFGTAALACAILALVLTRKQRYRLCILSGALTLVSIVISDIFWCSALWNSGKSLFLLWIEGFPPAFILSVILAAIGILSVVRGAIGIHRNAKDTT